MDALVSAHGSSNGPTTVRFDDRMDSREKRTVACVRDPDGRAISDL